MVVQIIQIINDYNGLFAKPLWMIWMSCKNHILDQIVLFGKAWTSGDLVIYKNNRTGLSSLHQTAHLDDPDHLQKNFYIGALSLHNTGPKGGYG